ncbi:MAG: hypothetical protein ACYCOU_24985 [Sulfobacillus sp.]
MIKSAEQAQQSNRDTPDGLYWYIGGVPIFTPAKPHCYRISSLAHRGNTLFRREPKNLRGILMFAALFSSFILVAFISSICLFAFVGVMMSGIGGIHA